MLTVWRRRELVHYNHESIMMAWQPPCHHGHGGCVSILNQHGLMRVVPGLASSEGSVSCARVVSPQHELSLGCTSQHHVRPGWLPQL